MFKVNKKTPERRQWYFTYFTPLSSVFIVDFEQVNVNWVICEYWMNCPNFNYKKLSGFLIFLLHLIFVLIEKKYTKLSLLWKHRFIVALQNKPATLLKKHSTVDIFCKFWEFSLYNLFIEHLRVTVFDTLALFALISLRNFLIVGLSDSFILSRQKHVLKLLIKHYINLLLASVPILCDLKIPEKLVLLRFQKVQNGNIGQIWAKASTKGVL